MVHRKFSLARGLVMANENRQLEDKYILRLPDGMRDKLKGLAADNVRSMNAEIVTRLASTLEETDLAEVLRSIDDRLSQLSGDDYGLKSQLFVRSTRVIQQAEKLFSHVDMTGLPERPSDDIQGFLIDIKRLKNSMRNLGKWEEER